MECYLINLSILSLTYNIRFVLSSLVFIFDRLFVLIASNYFPPWSLNVSNYSLFLLSIFFSLSKRLSFLFLSSNPLLKTLPNGEYLNLASSTTPGLYSKSSPAKYSYLFSFLDNNTEILAASLSKSYWAWFALILSSRTLSSSVNVNFVMKLKHFY